MKSALLATLIVAFGSMAFLQRPALQLALVDLQGNHQNLGGLPISTFAPRISPNGKQLTFDTQENGPEVWVADFPSLQSRRKLTSDAQYPMWSADNERIFYIAVHNGQQALYWRFADGTGAAELLAEPARAPEHWLPKMGSITFITLSNGDYDVWRYSIADKKASPLIVLPQSSQHSSRVSPDQRWIAYASNETGKFEVFVQPIPTTGAKYQITSGGGEHPVWSPDGGQIYFNRDDRLFSVAVKTETAVTAGSPTALPISGFIQDVGRRQFDITADGKQFLMLFPPR
jgi:Tol biopolymer transport system component